MAPLRATLALQTCACIKSPHAAICNSGQASLKTWSRNSVSLLASQSSCPDIYLHLARTNIRHDPQAGSLRRSRSQSAPAAPSLRSVCFPIEEKKSIFQSSSAPGVGAHRRRKRNLFSVSGITVPPGTGAIAAGVLVMASALNDPFFQLGIAVAIPTIAGAISGAKFRPDSWYFELKKPWWDPPAPVFGGAWGILYPLMGVASWLVWTKGGFRKQAIPLTLYALQLVLNVMWPAAFFGKKDMRMALLDIVALLGTLLITTLLFRMVNPVAGKMMSLYLAWVAFATALNYKLLQLNQA